VNKGTLFSYAAKTVGKLQIYNSAQNLQLRHLSDIHLTLKYRYDKPPQITFPQ
jgi:hypothetical protein